MRWRRRERVGVRADPGAKAVQAIGRELELGPEVRQVPAQILDQRSALANTPLVLMRRPDLKLDPGQSCCRDVSKPP